LIFNFELTGQPHPRFLMPHSPKIPPGYRDELNKSILIAKAREADVSLGADTLCLKDRSGEVILDDDPDETHAYHPGDAKHDFESFLSYGLRFYLFDRQGGSGEADYSQYKWSHSEGFDVIGNASYLEGHGFDITLELVCPCLAKGKRIRLEHRRLLESWPTLEYFTTLQSDIDDLIKDWNLLEKFQAYILHKKIDPFDVGPSYIIAEDFIVTAREGAYWFRSKTCKGDWDQATIDAYERVTQKFSDWLKPKLTPGEELPNMETILDLV